MSIISRYLRNGVVGSGERIVMKRSVFIVLCFFSLIFFSLGRNKQLWKDVGLFRDQQDDGFAGDMDPWFYHASELKSALVTYFEPHQLDRLIRSSKEFIYRYAQEMNHEFRANFQLIGWIEQPIFSMNVANDRIQSMNLFMIQGEVKDLKNVRAN